ncbi:MAG: toxin C-terminal domain-containing protein [Neisseriaceae bacterium]|nr:toxin C-terminal domain-containing protein [Neisseriaceae bacterium]
MAITGISYAAAQSIIAAQQHGANKRTVSDMVSQAQATSGGAIPPDDDDNWKNNKKKQEEHRKISNSEIKKEAEKLGYKLVKEKSHGELVFKKGNSYISFDRTSHSGGYWKEASSPNRLNLKQTRNGTFNKNLTKKVGD